MSYLNGLKDTREDKSTNNLLNTQRTKTRSGHVLELNDNQGVEHITLQHRTGALIQFQPDGSVRFVSQNGKMGFEINGEGYVNVTGAYYIAAKSGQITIENDLDMTVHGDMKLTVDGTYSVAAKNMTTTIAEKYELTADSATMAMTNNTVFTAGGSMLIASDGLFYAASLGNDMLLEALAGKMTRNANSKISDTASRIDHN